VRQFLTFPVIPVFQVSLGTARVPFLSATVSTTDTGGPPGSTAAAIHLELVLAEIPLGEERFILPGQQHVADAPLTNVTVEPRGRCQHRHVLVEIADELLALSAEPNFFSDSPRRRESSARALRMSSDFGG